MVEKRKIKVGKIDLDTIGAAYLLGVSREDEVEMLRGEASAKDLANPDVICIEVGGSSQVHLMNFDHHGEGAPSSSATQQVWDYWDQFIFAGSDDETARMIPVVLEVIRKISPYIPWLRQAAEKYSADLGFERKPGNYYKDIFFVESLVEYVDLLDTSGPEPLRKAFREAGMKPEQQAPFLSDVISGILILEKPLEALFKSIEALDRLRCRRHPVTSILYGEGLTNLLRKETLKFLQRVRFRPEEVERYLRGVKMRHFPTFGRMDLIPEFRSYIKAKAENNRQVAEVLERATWETTSTGFKLATIESSFYGVVGALYGTGAQVVVALNPDYRGIRKFTIAGNGIRVDDCLDQLNAKEPGWGGPASGTILGSSREGSKLSLEKVVGIVRKIL